MGPSPARGVVSERGPSPQTLINPNPTLAGTPSPTSLQQRTARLHVLPLQPTRGPLPQSISSSRPQRLRHPLRLLLETAGAAEVGAEAEAGRRSGNCPSTSRTPARTRSRSSHLRSSPVPLPPPDRPSMVIMTLLLLRVTAPKMMPGPMLNLHAAGSLFLCLPILSRYEAAMVLD